MADSAITDDDLDWIWGALAVVLLIGGGFGAGFLSKAFPAFQAWLLNAGLLVSGDSVAWELAATPSGIPTGLDVARIAVLVAIAALAIMTLLWWIHSRSVAPARRGVDRQAR